MQNLDLRTVILLSGLMGALMALVLTFLQRSTLNSIKGPMEWAWAALTCVVAALALGARGILPDFLAVVVGNLLLIGAICLYSIGTRRFFSLPPRIPLFASILVISGLLLTWYGVVKPDYSVRLQFVSALLALIFLQHAWMLHRRSQGSFAFRFTMTILLLQSVVSMARAVTAGTVAADATILSPSPMQTAFIASFPIMMLALSIGVFLLATERMRGDLEYLATHDIMTGTLNRRAIVETAERELARCRRHGHVMSLLMMDLDHFKKINDTYGHLVGDHVLREFAGKVSVLLRLPDQFGRYGGEEFLLILPDTGREAAAVVADRICKAAADSMAPAYTVSIGLATATLIDTDIDSLLARADAALYRAKAGGRNQVVMAPLLQEVPAPDATAAILRPVA
jgi:diguanylate cyclase (GGDEF)-like protein